MRKILLAVFVLAVLAVVRIPQVHAAPVIVLDPVVFDSTEACTQASGCPESEMTAYVTWYWKINITDVRIGDTTNFAITSTSCSGTVYVDCNVYLAFHPTTPDHHETTLTIEYTDSKGVPGTVSATISGEGFVPALEVVPWFENFGPKALNSGAEVRGISITNPALIDIPIASIALSEGSDASFGVDQACVTTLAPEGTCEMGVSFNPTDASAVDTSVYGWVIIRTQYEENVWARLEGYVLPENERDLSYSKSALDFNTQTVGTESGPQTFTITNIGVPDVAIASIVSDSAEFPVTHDCPATLAHGLSCTVSQTFLPAAAGARAGTVTITSDAPEAGTTFTVALSGFGVDPAQPSVVLSPASLDFGSVSLGSSATLFVRLTNEGGAALNVSTVTTAAPFAVDTDCDDNAVSPDGGRCSIMVTFTPTAAGDVAGTITITDDAADSPQTVDLKGTGSSAAIPVASLSASSIDFGSQAVGTTTTRTLTITNTGTSDLAISLTTLDGEGVAAYSKADGCRGTNVSPNATCTIDFSFTPADPGQTYVAALSIDDNAADSPQSVALTGAGVQPSPGSGCSLSAAPFGLSGGAAVAAALALLAGLRLVSIRRRR